MHTLLFSNVLWLFRAIIIINDLLLGWLALKCYKTILSVKNGCPLSNVNRMKLPESIKNVKHDSTLLKIKIYKT